MRRVQTVDHTTSLDSLAPEKERIRVGLTEAHGMALEAKAYPPTGVEYSFLAARPASFRFVRSPIKGYYGRYESADHHLLEAVLSPIATRNRWIYSVESLAAAAAFSLLGFPLPRAFRVSCLTALLLRENCRKIVFWSEAGRKTLHSYGAIDDERLLRKVTVVHPAVRRVPDASIRFHDRDAVQLLFSGDFFRKGGVNVVDAFERAQRRYPSIRLTVCSDVRIDFNTRNAALKAEYMTRLRANPGIEWIGRVDRDELVTEILPRTDIYLLPTYAETFGMAILEAMAFAIPVIATNHFAIPEMLDDETSGLLIDTRAWDTERLFQGYVVNTIPATFREFVTEELFARLTRLIESEPLRRRLGSAALATARGRFSFEARNEKMLQIYRDALS